MPIFKTFLASAIVVGVLSFASYSLFKSFNEPKVEDTCLRQYYFNSCMEQKGTTGEYCAGLSSRISIRPKKETPKHCMDVREWEK
jgi:hypothetical protein